METASKLGDKLLKSCKVFRGFVKGRETVYVFVSVEVGMCKWVCIHVCRGQRTTFEWWISGVVVLRQVSSLTRITPRRLAWLAIKLQKSPSPL